MSRIDMKKIHIIYQQQQEASQAPNLAPNININQLINNLNNQPISTHTGANINWIFPNINFSNYGPGGELLKHMWDNMSNFGILDDWFSSLFN